MDRELILQRLGGANFKGNYQLINADQKVKDIIEEILDAHEHFSADYNRIALCFDDDTVKKVCANVYNFCKKYLKYYEQTEHEQMTMSPAAMIELEDVDCKNYAGFCGGILDGLNRLTDRKIKWCYRFASYRFWDKNPHHVFVVVNPGENEIWFDPTPGADHKTPIWQQDIEINSGNMALYRVSGVSENSAVGFLNAAKLVTFAPGEAPGQSNPYFAGIPFLGLEKYGEDGSTGILPPSWNATADAINAAIAKGPSPGHQYNGEFVKWIYETSNKGWNFYYPHGVIPGFNPGPLLPANYPRPIVTTDNRLVFDRDGVIEYWRNNEAQAMTAWVQSILNDYGDGHIMQPKSLKEFTTGKYGGREQYNMFHEYRGDSFLKELGKAIEDAVNWVKDGVLKIVGSIPRNAFLALVGLNAFGWANKLQEKIDGGAWDQIANTWKSVGGNPDKLRNTIADGAKKTPAVGNAIGEPGSVSAFIASAAPIVAIMIKFLDKDGKAAEIVNAAIPALQKQFPDVDFSPLKNAMPAIDRLTGKPVQWTVDDKDNENLGGGNDDLPQTGFFNKAAQWVKDNPIQAAAAAAVLWELLAPAKYKLSKLFK